jgi:hypothetical protein
MHGETMKFFKHICVIVAYYFSGKMITFYRSTIPYLKLLGASVLQNSKYFEF